jgi:hypothetical protein
MDNGLIFPYPHKRVPGEIGDANRPNHFPSLRGRGVASAEPKPIVAKRWGDAGGQPRQ